MILLNKNTELLKNKYKNFISFGNYTKRLSLNPIHVELPIPNLLNVQLENFFYFVNVRIDEIFREVFPIENETKTIRIEYVSCEFKKGDQDLKTIKDQGKNYEAALYAKFILYKNDKKDSEKKLFICFFPWMTNKASFIINGVEKVVVSQFLKSPGIYFNISRDVNGSETVYFNLTPLLGTWIEAKISDKHLINIKINKTKKIQFSSLFTCLGFNLELLNEVFEDNRYIINTYAKEEIVDKKTAIINLLHKINPSEPLLNQKQEIIELFKKHFFSPSYYDLSKAGRYKLNQKINFVDRLFNFKLAKDILKTNNKVLINKNTVIHQKQIDLIQKAIDNNELKKSKIYLSDFGDIEYFVFYIYHPNLTLPEEDKKIVKIISPAKLDNEKVCLELIDFICILNYLLNLADGVGSVDDIDDISSRRIRVVSELIENQLKFAFIKMKKNIQEMMISSSIEGLNLKRLINSKSIISVIKEFFNISQLCQFIDQTNVLSEFSNKRKISSLGPKGLIKERAGLEVRDVHNSHYNRICPIETPEGPNIGLILNLGCYSRINRLGFIETPYFVVKNGVITNEVRYLDGNEEKKYIIFAYNPKFLDKSKIISEEVIAHYNSEFIVTNAKNIELASVSPKQLISVATACIPFLENNDANRALMGANMQRQAVPLLKTDAPLIATGIENKIATDSNVAIVAEEDGQVLFVDATEMIIKYNSRTKPVRIILSVFEKTNHNTCMTHVPLLENKAKFKKGQVLADGPSMKKGELALGSNVLVGFCTWYGYNFEDAIIISERLVKNDIFTSLHIEEFVVEARITNQGHEEITRDIINVSEKQLKYLDNDGVIIPGTRVHSGDILVGKVTPREEISSTPEDKLLQVIFGEKSRHFKDSSLRVPVGSGGIVVDIKHFSKQKKDNLSSDVSEMIKVYILQKRKIQAGDKMSGRHGNKGVVSIVVPEEDMPFLEDGTPIDVLLNPLGVPGRMNIGQILETQLGLAANTLNIKMVTPVFEAPSEMQITEFIKDAGLPEDCKFKVIDGKTGEPFAHKILIGYMYMLKLSHMVEDKIHARAIGPYSLITQQPLGGKAQNGGQRCGEMEVWAFEGYGAAHLLQELLTIKSDDIIGRIRTYESIIWENKTYKPNISESFLVLTSELKGLGINVELKRK